MARKNMPPTLAAFIAKYKLGLIGGLIVILLAVTALSWKNYDFRDLTDYEAQKKQSELERQEYQKILDSINVTPEQSEVALKKIATEDIVRDDVTTALQINQKITAPDIKDSELVFTPRGDRQAVVDYFVNTAPKLQNYNAATAVANQTVFTQLQDNTSVAFAAEETRKLATTLRQTPVPQELRDYHKAKITTYEQYADFLDSAQQYGAALGATPPLAPRGQQGPWPRVYKDYIVINNQSAVIQSEAQRLDQKFGLSKELIHLAAVEVPAEQKALAVRLGLVKEAEAIFGFGDLTITMGDIPRLIIYGVEQGLAQAFTTFLVGAVDNLVAKIDKYFNITSQLYYSQELGKLYSKEYWKKFNVSVAEQNLIKHFLPQYFCPTSPTELGRLKQVFAAKSKQLLNYDIATVPFESSDYYLALAELGDAAQTNPDLYWSDRYASAAGAVGSAAADAVSKEVNSPGLKAARRGQGEGSARDLIADGIEKTVNKILHVEAGSVNSVLNLGTSKADSLVATIVSGIFQELTTKFIFTGLSLATGGRSSLSVVNEQPFCLSSAQYKPVIGSQLTEEEETAVNEAEIKACLGLFEAYKNALASGATTGLNDAAIQRCLERVPEDRIPDYMRQSTTQPPTDPSDDPGDGLPPRWCVWFDIRLATRRIFVCHVIIIIQS